MRLSKISQSWSPKRLKKGRSCERTSGYLPKTEDTSLLVKGPFLKTEGPGISQRSNSALEHAIQIH